MGKSEVLYFYTFGQAQSYYLHTLQIGQTVSHPFEHNKGWAVIILY